MEKDKAKSRTVRLTDEEWEEIGTAALHMGFGKRGRGRAMVKLARERNKKEAAKKSAGAD